MKRYVFLITSIFVININSWAVAQDQEAGKLTDTEAVFQKLVEQCDNVDMLMLRARIRLELPRTTDDAADTAKDKLLQGFELCAAGKMAEGKKSKEEENVHRKKRRKQIPKKIT